MNCMTCGKLFLEEGIKVHYNSCIEVLVDTAWMYLLSIWIISFLNTMIFCAIPKCVVLCLVNHKQAKYRMVHLQGNCCFKMPCFSSKPFEAITSWHHWVIDSLLPLQFSCLWIMKRNMKCETASCIYFITILLCICKQGTRTLCDFIKDLNLKDLGLILGSVVWQVQVWVWICVDSCKNSLD